MCPDTRHQRIDVYHHYPCTIIWIVAVILTAIVVHILEGT